MQSTRGTNIQVNRGSYDCKGKNNQPANCCVSPDDNSMNPSTNLQLWGAFPDHLTQQWIFDTSETPDTNIACIRNAQDPSKCLAVDSNKHENGTNIQLWGCDCAD